MLELKKKIRDLVCDCLKNSFSKVYTNNSRARTIGKTPTVSIHTSEEKFRTKVLFPRFYDCELLLAIEIAKREEKKIEDELDILASAVNKIICESEKLDLLGNIELVGIETDFDSETDDIVGGCRLNYRVKYEVEAPNILGNFNKFKGGNIDFI